MESGDQYVYGKHPVEDILQRHPDKVSKIYLRENLKPASIHQIESLSSQNRIPVVRVPGKKLNELVGPVNDQGIVAQISEVSYIELEDWLSGDLDIQANPVILLLDEIEDPHNFGAILRTAAAADVDAVIVPKHRQTPVNATVFKTSAGTAGLIPIIRVTNLNQTIMKLKDYGFWVTGLDQLATNTLWEQNFDMPIAVVVGSEGKGIREKTLKHCDFTIRIPMSNGVESLNASVSVSLLCYEIARKRSLPKPQNQ